MIVLGIDPGLKQSGWGVLENTQNSRLIYKASGLITTRTSASIPERLAHIFKEVTAILEMYQPHEVAVEEVFVNKNPETSLKLALARGVILCAPSVFGRPVFAYAPNHIKKAVVGHGHAEKQQLAWVLQKILALPEAPVKDASDALAVALCHAHSRIRS